MPVARRESIIANALTRHAAGESLRQIAPDMGISHVRLRAILLGDVPEQYRAAQADALIERIAEADELLDGAIAFAADGTTLDHARSSVNIARAREIGKFARWDAERRLPKLFGAAAAVTVNLGRGVVNMSDAELERIARPAIDVTPEVDT